jgi:pimeloyl-ACP methyl ester carboxylesterase
MLKILFAICFFITACSAVTPPDNFVYEEIQTSTFKIAVWHKITNPQAPLKVYIEGDGAAFRANGKISANPTPHGTLVRQLAFGDDHENVVYLARPCQFVQDSMCAQKYWSTARFAPEIIAAEYEALQKIGGNYPLTLVGFSGGAQIAGLLAVKYSDLNVKKLITIAGNLDHTAWTTYHHLPPLTFSEDLKNYRQQYLSFQQVHYIGKKDDNVLPFITENFVGDKNRLIYIENASHNAGWQTAYGQIQAQ